MNQSGIRILENARWAKFWGVVAGLWAVTIGFAAVASADTYNGTPAEHKIALHSFANINQEIAAGWRPTSIEIEQNLQSVSLFRVAYVKNTSSHYKQVQFANYETKAQIDARRNNGWRIEDVEVIVSGSAPRFSAIMIRNVTNPQQTSFFYDRTTSEITSLLSSYNGRLIDLDRYPISGNERFSGVMVKNSGATASAWGWGPAWTWTQIGIYASANNMRVIDLDRRPDGLYAVVFKKRQSGERTWYFGNRTLQQVQDLISGGGFRVIGLNETTSSGSARYSGAAVNNTNSIASRVADMVIGKHNGFQGMYLRQLGSGTIVNLNGSRAFHPSSSIKVLVHYHAADTTPAAQLNTRIISSQSMLLLCRNMMWNSDNPSTNTLMAAFGKPTIESNGRVDGPMSVITRLINNMGTGGPYNNNPFTTTTLTDMSQLYERIQVGNTLGATKQAWVRANMNNETNTSFFDAVNASVRSQAGISTSRYNDWRSRVKWIYKSGNNSDSNDINGYWSSCGTMTLPFKSASGVVTTRTFAFGLFVNGSTIDYRAGAGPTAELLREQIALSMDTFK